MVPCPNDSILLLAFVLKTEPLRIHSLIYAVLFTPSRTFIDPLPNTRCHPFVCFVHCSEQNRQITTTSSLGRGKNKDISINLYYISCR